MTHIKPFDDYTGEPVSHADRPRNLCVAHDNTMWRDGADKLQIRTSREAALAVAKARAPIGEVGMTELMMVSQALIDASKEIERLRAAATKAADIIDKHLNTQSEKVADAAYILRAALEAKD